MRFYLTSGFTFADRVMLCSKTALISPVCDPVNRVRVAASDKRQAGFFNRDERLNEPSAKGDSLDWLNGPMPSGRRMTIFDLHRRTHTRGTSPAKKL
jgi:hypothetical protein